MEKYLLIIFVIAFLLAAVAGMMIYFGRKKKKGLSELNFAKMWSHVKEMVQTEDKHRAVQAVMEADKLMDLVLKKKVSGKDMGERLRLAKGLFSADGYHRIWGAHKLRNQLAHEVGVDVSLERCRGAVSDFARGFRDLGYRV